MKTKWWMLIIGVISVFFIVCLTQAHIDMPFQQDYPRTHKNIQELEKRVKALEKWKEGVEDRLARLTVQTPKK